MNYPVSVGRHHVRVLPTINDEEHLRNMQRAGTTEETRLLQIGRQRSYMAQTSAEVSELEEMLTNTSSTPRKAKRVYSMLVYFKPMVIRVAAKRTPPES